MRRIFTVIVIASLIYAIVYVANTFGIGQILFPSESAGQEEQSHSSSTTGKEGTSAPSPGTVAPGSEPPERVIAVPADKLSDTQKQLLRSFGIDSANVTISAATVSCAEDALGKERIDQIVGGATPTFTESLKLVACYKK